MIHLPRSARYLALVLLAACSLAMARDLDQDEALALRQKGSSCRSNTCWKLPWGVTPGRACWRPSWRRMTIAMNMKSSC